MIAKIIKFKDLDSKDVEEEFYFHISKGEVAEMVLEGGENFEDYLKTIIADQNGKEIIRTFKEILRKTVGQRSEDNRRFIKTDEIADAFMQSDAYSVLFVGMLTNAGEMAEFINGAFPEDFAKEIVKELNDEPAKEKTYDQYTQTELIEMSHQDFTALVSRSKRGSNIPQELLIAGFNRKK